ncbi:MAG: TonB-dependent receptor [Candidatus Solibacter usitatus]|nr:TonB-dependent receptor [Candidatus Solibacter usitatus]
MLRRISLAITLSLAMVAGVRAQVSTAELVGVVTDASGASITGAKVVLTNRETSQSREASTDQLGNYIFTLIPPGIYNLSVEAAGFKKFVQNDAQLQVNQRARIDFSLQVGQVSETVEVAAAAPLLESQSSSLGSVISERFVGELPLNGRNFVQLAILSPGVNGTGYSTSGTIQSGARPDDRRPGTEIFSNGNREGSNNFLYDGVDNNERLIQLIVYRPAVEAIREFKVQTNLYSADLGRNSGAVVDVVSKSGTNEFHGSLFEFLRNSAMDARSFFNAKGTTFPPFRYNQYGFSLGGPVWLPKVYNGKNKTFFFVDYEGYRRNTVQSSVRSVPTVKIRQGDFSDEDRIFDPLSNQTTPTGFTRTQFPGNRIPQTRWDPATTKLMAAFPLPQNSGRLNNYLANLNLVQNWDQGDVRVDHQVTPNDNFFARWSIQHTTTTAPYTFPAAQIPGLPKPAGLGNEDSFAGPAFNPVQHAVASYVKVLNPRLINEFRAGFNRFVLDYTGEGFEAGGPNLGNLLGIRNANSHPLHTLVPIFNLGSYTGIGHSRSLPIFRRSNTFQYTDNVTWTIGAHTLKFGGDFRRRQITEYQTNRGNGRFNFSRGFTTETGGGATGNEAASFLLGYAQLVEQDFTLAWVGARGVEPGLYFADDYRVNRKLTLNIGLRWEYYSPFNEVANRWANFDADTATIKVAGRDGVDSRAGIQRDFRNFSPRLGFAYQLTPRTVARGGFGLFFNPNGNGGALLRLQRHVPFGPIYSQSNNNTTVGTRVSDGFPDPPQVNFDSLKNPSGGVIGVFPGFTSAYAEQFNLTVQHEVAPWKTLFSLGYVGNLGRRLGTTIDLNQPLPGPGAVGPRRAFFAKRPGLAGISYAVSDGLSNYNALQATVNKRMSQGLSLLFGYTWSHAIDDVGTEFGGGTGTPQDIRNRRADRGNSVYDMRHRVTLSYTYQLPWGKGQRWMNRGGIANLILGGWQTNGIWIGQTGLPFTVGSQNADTGGAGGSRPDFIRDGTLSGDQRTILRWFDPTGYATPKQYTFGNTGRNTLFGPGRTNVDMSLFKDFPIKEEFKVQFRAEAFNVFNHPQFGQPNASVENSQAGRITSLVGNPRQLQVALRVQW